MGVPLFFELKTHVEMFCSTPFISVHSYILCQHNPANMSEGIKCLFLESLKIHFKTFVLLSNRYKQLCVLYFQTNYNAKVMNDSVYSCVEMTISFNSTESRYTHQASARIVLLGGKSRNENTGPRR